MAGLARLEDATAREVMTPRFDVVALEAPVALGDVADAVRRSGHSRFPVYEENLDRLAGVLFVKDLFRLGLWGTKQPERGRSPAAPAGISSGGAEQALAAAGGTGRADGHGADGVRGAGEPVTRLRKPFLVPESKLVIELLADMRQRRMAFAIVVDEYGGVEGVVTIKDLVSLLVGELPDEFDRADEEEITPIDASRWLVDGSCPVERLREEIGIEVPAGDYLTLGGFLFKRFGRIPAEGDSVVFGGTELKVTEMDKRRIAKVVVRALSASIPGNASRGAGK
ncbi:MAG: hemolysin family protein [Acidimicrobiales bacterium]